AEQAGAYHRKADGKDDPGREHDQIASSHQSCPMLPFSGIAVQHQCTRRACLPGGIVMVTVWRRTAATGGAMAATVLVVEDERKLRDFIRTYLERAGFTVLSTGSGAEALTMAASSAPDLVVLDLGLPDVPGE